MARWQNARGQRMMHFCSFFPHVHSQNIVNIVLCLSPNVFFFIQISVYVYLYIYIYICITVRMICHQKLLYNFFRANKAFCGGSGHHIKVGLGIYSRFVIYMSGKKIWVFIHKINNVKSERQARHGKPDHTTVFNLSASHF